MKELPFYTDFRDGIASMIDQIYSAIVAGEWVYLVAYFLLLLIVVVLAVMSFMAPVLGFIIALRKAFPGLPCFREKESFIVSTQGIPTSRKPFWLKNPGTGEFDEI